MTMTSKNEQWQGGQHYAKQCDICSKATEQTPALWRRYDGDDGDDDDGDDIDIVRIFG